MEYGISNCYMYEVYKQGAKLNIERQNLFYFHLLVLSIFCLIRCVDVSNFRRFDVLTFRCFVHGPV